MANIIDYVLWRGDLKICEDFPFNEVDSMIMARLSYLIFEKIQVEQKQTIEELARKFKKFKNEEFNYDGDMQLIANLGKSIRFKNLIVSDYIANSSLEIEKQFAAISIHLPGDEIYVSYEGTDKTLNAWKEDFNLGFMKNVPAQVEGKKYLEKIAQKYPNKKIRAGGHSKGGNIAIYSAITADNNIQDRIIKVYNYDGPGFLKSVIDNYGNNCFINKITTYVPQDSVIGRLLYHKEESKVVLSLEKGIYEHDIYSWQVIKDSPIILDEVSKSSETINKSLTNFLENTTELQRKLCSDTVFSILYSVDVTSTIDIKKELIKKLPGIIKAYKDVSEDDKKQIMDAAKVFIKAYIQSVKNNELNK